MVSGAPSPAALSPLLVSRSTGPQPLVADSQGRSPRYDVPAGGAVTTDAVSGTLPVTGVPDGDRYLVRSVSAYEPVGVPAGAVTCQPVRRVPPVARAGAEVAEVARTVQPA